MKIRMLETTLGSPNGITVNTYQEGNIYDEKDLGTHLTEAFLKDNKAEPYIEPEPKPEETTLQPEESEESAEAESAEESGESDESESLESNETNPKKKRGRRKKSLDGAPENK